MKKLILLLILSSFWSFSIAQSSIIIEPNPSSAGVLTDLKLNTAGKVVAQNDVAKTLYYNAANLDFLPISTLTSRWNAFTRDHEPKRIAYFDATQNESSFMIAPVHLPDGAVITRFRAFIIDNTSLEILFVELIRRQKGLNTIPTEDVMANVQTTGNSSNLQSLDDTSILNSTINNNTHYYFVKVKIGDFTGDATQQWRADLLGIRNVELQYTY